MRFKGADMSSVFFSYASEDRPRLSPFVSAFQGAHIDVLVDYNQMGAGRSIPEGINSMIEQASGAILFFSNHYAIKPWTKEEQNALQFRSVERADYKLVVVRLDETELPPLLAHRLWKSDAAPGSVANAFSSNVRSTLLGSSAAHGEFHAWSSSLTDEELERLAITVSNQLTRLSTTVEINWHAGRLGHVLVRLHRPVLSRLVDNLASALRMLERVDFLRRHLSERIKGGGLAVFEASFLLEEQERVRQIEGYKSELRDTLVALVDRVELV